MKKENDIVFSAAIQVFAGLVFGAVVVIFGAWLEGPPSCVSGATTSPWTFFRVVGYIIIIYSVYKSIKILRDGHVEQTKG